MQDELAQTAAARTDAPSIFISHDLDEAIRIGDRIAIMEGGRVVQIGTPEDILKNPADEYVRSFFRGVDPTTVFSVGDVARKNQVTILRQNYAGPRATLERLQDEDREFAYVLTRDRNFQGVVSIDSLREAIENGTKDIGGIFMPEIRPVSADTPLQEVLTVVRQYPCPVPVVDENNEYIGVVSKNRFLRTIEHGMAQSEEAIKAAQTAA